ncbi:hypothetical protein DFO61_3358 [Ectopseudomonas oleovorans]|uniref:Phage tail assembly protein n=1 Tax=Ectopseudomonas oleovorans TaxID=301 RepID=A0A397MG59_ECTOL|nr:hypothetical protein [Pseudomonas oleovorans]RIA22668.1 hypothetical protein DFO61_3358 [Pseudomonas oleovorans]
MASLGKTKTIGAGDIEVTVREVTVAGVRSILARAGTGDVVDELLLDVRLQDLVDFTSLTAEQVEQMRPSDLAVVVEACKEVNPDFFAMLAKAYKV